MEQPCQIDQRRIEEGWRLAREAVVLGDVTGRTLIEVRGADALRFLHNFSTADFRSRQAGDVVEAFLTTDQGRTKAFVVASILATDAVWLDAGRTPAGEVVAHLGKYAVTDRVEFLDRTDEVRHFVLIGPKAEEILQSVFPEPAGGREGRKCWSIGSGLAYFGGYPGCEPCWHIVGEAGGQLPWEASGGMQPVETLVLTAVQIESLWPESGIEVTDEHFPQEFRRDERAISFTKGCYLGQETVARIQTYGHVNRYLVRFVFESTENVPLQGVTIEDDGGRTVGHVTTVGYVPPVSGFAGLGFVRRGYEEPGTRLVWRAEGTSGSARVW